MIWSRIAKPGYCWWRLSRKRYLKVTSNPTPASPITVTNKKLFKQRKQTSNKKLLNNFSFSFAIFNKSWRNTITSTVNAENNTVLYVLPKLRHADIRTRDHQKKTALMTALIRGHVAIVKLLLTKYTNVDLEILDTDRRNIIHYAIQSEDSQILKV